MNPEVSLGALFSRLEKKLGELREQVAFHREQETFHHDQGERLGAELERLTRHHAVFHESAEAVLGAADEAPAKSEEGKAGGSLGARPKLARLVAEVVDSLPPAESFGRTRVAQEVAERYGAALSKRVEPRLVSIALQRLADAGRIHQISKGRPHHEALYRRQKPASGPRGK